MSTESNEFDFQIKIREILDQGTTRLDDRTTLRLYEARCDALRHHGGYAQGLNLAGGIGMLTQTFHVHYRALLAIVLVALGATTTQLWFDSQQAEELAEIDSALLGDEVTPSAYTDPGFLEWLDSVSESQDDSLPD